MGEKTSGTSQGVGCSFLQNNLGNILFDQNLFLADDDSDFSIINRDYFQRIFPFRTPEFSQRTNFIWNSTPSTQLTSNSDWLGETGKGIFLALTQLATGFVTGIFEFQLPVIGIFHGLESLCEGTVSFFRRGIYEETSSVAYNLTLLISTAALLAIGLRSHCGNRRNPKQKTEFCLEDYRLSPAYVMAETRSGNRVIGSRKFSPSHEPLILMSSGKRVSWWKPKSLRTDSGVISPSRCLTRREIKKNPATEKTSFPEILDGYEILIKDALEEVRKSAKIVSAEVKNLHHDLKGTKEHHNRHALAKRRAANTMREELKSLRDELKPLQARLEELNQSMREWFNEWFENTSDNVDEALRRQADALLQERLRQVQGIGQKLVAFIEDRKINGETIAHLRQKITSVLLRNRDV